jgi:hypothetical protein
VAVGGAAQTSTASAFRPQEAHSNAHGLCQSAKCKSHSTRHWAITFTALAQSCCECDLNGPMMLWMWFAFCGLAQTMVIRLIQSLLWVSVRSCVNHAMRVYVQAKCTLQSQPTLTKEQSIFVLQSPVNEIHTNCMHFNTDLLLFIGVVCRLTWIVVEYSE